MAVITTSKPTASVPIITTGQSSKRVLTDAAIDFISFVAVHSQKKPVSDEIPRVRTSTLSSSIATVYEQLRNTVDRTEQHLLRRNAIYRFLKRYVMVYGRRDKLGSLLINELVRSGYVPNNTFPAHDVVRLDEIIEKNVRVIDQLRVSVPEIKTRDHDRWGLGLAAAEIEHFLYNPERELALVHFAFDDLKQRIQWEDNGLAESERDMQLYLAIHRAVFRSDALLIEYHLLSAYYTGKPDWQSPSADPREMAAHAVKFREIIRAQINHPKAGRLAQQVKRMLLPYRTLFDMVVANPQDGNKRIEDVETFLADAQKVIQNYYKQNRRAIRKSAVRSVLFIFITKMTLALAFEIPYDLSAVGHIRYIPLGINVAFHPLFLFVLGTLVRFPEKENTQRILVDLRATVLREKTAPLYYIQLQSERSSVTNFILLGLYLLTFAVTFGGLVYLLREFNFGLLGGGLFLFFLTLVTFVGIRLRARAHTYFMVRRKESLVGSLFWFFANPMVEVGRWMSQKFVRYNLFLFLFDIILEAPFKAITHGLEEWFRFARERSEEITE